MQDERTRSRPASTPMAPGSTSGQLPHWYGRSLLLLAAQVLLLLLMPILARVGDEGFVLSALLTLVLLAAVYGLGSRRRVLIAGAILVVPALFQTWSGEVLDGWRYDALSGAAGLVFYVYAIITILAYVLRRGPVTLDRLYAAVSVYLLIGMTFAIAYMLLHRLSPPAFASSTIDPIDNQAIIYFSYVTLTTLGYGDVTPVLPLARSLAVLEAIIGVLFIAVFVARLVAALPGRTASGDGASESSGG